MSTNTWENAVSLHRLLQDRGVSRVVLVTNAWHMPRSRWCFEQQGFSVIPAPVDYLTSQRAFDVRGLVPDAGVLADSSLALHEYIGIAWYRMRFGHDWTLRWPWQ